ncbi:MAG: phosphatase PAP2 family protein [Bacteroidota bacterium]|nr:phosphatase PAP2 family protein [Bacteroidota bacterium]
MKSILIIIFFLYSFTNTFSQHRFKTVRDTTKYNENSIDVRIFRDFNNIESKFVNSLVNITNESIVPVLIATPVGLYIGSRIYDNKYGENSAVLLALSEVTSGAVSQVMKWIFKRPRPYRTLNKVYLTDTSKLKGTYSFPSGHSTNSFAIATSLTLRYPDNPALIIGCYTYATLVALGRIYWGVHYPSDVFTGMVIGAGSAALIYSLRAPIIKGKNNLFNQSDWTDTDQSSVNPTVLVATFAVTDLINFYFSKSKSKILKNSKINFSSTHKINYLNYSFNF